MAIGVVATLKVAQGKESDFEAVFRDLAAQVKANEPGNQMYRVFKSKADANTYVIMEIYNDQAAVDTHNSSAHFTAAMPKIAPTLGGRPDIQFFDAV